MPLLFSTFICILPIPRHVFNSSAVFIPGYFSYEWVVSIPSNTFLSESWLRISVSFIPPLSSLHFLHISTICISHCILLNGLLLIASFLSVFGGNFSIKFNFCVARNTLEAQRLNEKRFETVQFPTQQFWKSRSPFNRNRSNLLIKSTILVHNWGGFPIYGVRRLTNPRIDTDTSYWNHNWAPRTIFLRLLIRKDNLFFTQYILTP